MYCNQLWVQHIESVHLYNSYSSVYALIKFNLLFSLPILLFILPISLFMLPILLFILPILLFVLPILLFILPIFLYLLLMVLPIQVLVTAFAKMPTKALLHKLL